MLNVRCRFRRRNIRRNTIAARSNPFSCILVAMYIDEGLVYCLLLLSLYNILLAHTLRDLIAKKILKVASNKRTPAKIAHLRDENAGADCDVKIFTARLEKTASRPIVTILTSTSPTSIRFATRGFTFPARLDAPLLGPACLTNVFSR